LPFFGNAAILKSVKNKLVAALFLATAWTSHLAHGAPRDFGGGADSESLRRRAVDLLGVGKTDEAEARLYDLIGGDPESPAAHFALAKLLDLNHQTGKLAAAKQEYDLKNARGLIPAELIPNPLQANPYDRWKNPTDALTELSRLCKFGGPLAAQNFLIGFQLNEQGMPGPAGYFYAHALELLKSAQKERVAKRRWILLNRPLEEVWPAWTEQIGFSIGRCDSASAFWVSRT
jgi:hypothetical protein